MSAAAFRAADRRRVESRMTSLGLDNEPALRVNQPSRPADLPIAASWLRSGNTPRTQQRARPVKQTHAVQLGSKSIPLILDHRRQKIARLSWDRRRLGLRGSVGGQFAFDQIKWVGVRRGSLGPGIGRLSLLLQRRYFAKYLKAESRIACCF